MPIKIPATKPDQSQDLEDGSDPQSPAPTRDDDGGGSSACIFSIIDSEKLKDPMSAAADNHPPSETARVSAGFYLRWTIIVLNVGLELAQIILTLEASGGKIRGPTYRMLTAITSSICLLLSAIEIAHATKRNGVVFKRKAQRIGFTLWFGLVSSTVQFSVNVTALALKAVVNLDYFGLMFSVCYFFAAINGDRTGAHVAVVKCVSHGSCQAERKFLDGMWVLQCSQCRDEEVKIA